MTAAEVSAEALSAVLSGVEVDGKPVPVYGSVPDRFTPPAVVVEPDEPWIVNDAPDMPYGVMEFRYSVRMLAGQGLGSKQAAVLIELAPAVLARLHGSPVWTPGQVGKPYALEVREGVSYLSADVSVSAIAHITE